MITSFNTAKPEIKSSGNTLIIGLLIVGVIGYFLYNKIIKNKINDNNKEYERK